MLSKVKILNGYSIQNTEDETIGKVKDIYFDDRHWTVRYLVANTGKWLTGRKVLISPYALEAVNADHENIVANLTKTQIEKSPSLDSDKPVSKQLVVGLLWLLWLAELLGWPVQLGKLSLPRG